MERTVDKFLVNLGDDSKEQGEFVESDESDDNEQPNDSYHLRLVQHL
jgi:hypothetical protein